MPTQFLEVTLPLPTAAQHQPRPKVSAPRPRPRPFPYYIHAAALMLIVLGAVIFRDFVFGNATILYKDLGSDTLNGYYPVVYHFSQYIRQYGIPFWSFSAGLGQNVFLYIGFLLFEPVVWLPSHLIAHALVYQHLLKVVFAGLLFFRFLQLRRLNFNASLLGSLLLAFSGYTIIASCWWSVLTNEAICATFALFAVEHALTRGRWIYLPFAALLFGVLTPIDLYLGGLLIGTYTVARLFELYGWRAVQHWKLAIQLGAITSLGAGLAAVVWLPGVAAVANSPRGSGVGSYVNTLRTFPVFGLEQSRYYLSALFRPFSNDVLGTAEHFHGWKNYFESPLTYCGLISLLLVPQVFVGANKRQRILYALFLLAIVIPTIFPWFRYLFWLFQGDYFRAFSLFSILVVVILSMTAFCRYIERGTLNIWTLAITCLVLLGVLYLPCSAIQLGLRHPVKELIALGLVGYTVLLIGGRYFGKTQFCGWLIIALCAAELCKFDRLSMVKRPTLTKQELTQPVGYNDGRTVTAVRDLKETDPTFYRVGKTFPAYVRTPAGPYPWDPSLNDAMLFGYYGTSSYSSFNNVHYIRILAALDAVPQRDARGAAIFPAEYPFEWQTRWIYGLEHRPMVSGFLSEKYVLTTDPTSLANNPCYSLFKTYDGLSVFQNRAFVPFGVFYTKFIPRQHFNQLPTALKERALLCGIVLPDEAVEDTTELKEATNEELAALNSIALEDLVAPVQQTALEIQSFSQNRIEGTARCPADGVLVLQMPFDKGWRAYVDGHRVPTIKVDSGLVGIKLAPGEHSIRLGYLPPLIMPGAVMTLVCSLVLLLVWRCCPQLKLVRIQRKMRRPASTAWPGVQGQYIYGFDSSNAF